MTGKALALIALIVSIALPAAARADVIPVASGSTTGTGANTSFTFTVPASNDRFLVVGISTTSNVVVNSVSFGPQLLTKQQANNSGAVRSETWTLVGPNTGTANVTVTLSGAAPLIAGAVSYAGVDQFSPIIVSSFGGVDNTSGNAASFITNGTTAKDGMFGTLTISPTDQTGAITTQGSTDLVVADNRWSTSQGTIRGAGSTRIGWTGANMSANSGISWLWQRVGGIVPFSYTWLAMKSTTGNTPPAVNAPTATNITQTTATLGGTMTSTGGQSVTQKGVVYCQCADPVIGGGGVVVAGAPTSDATGPFTVNVSGLTASRTYTYKAFAANSLGTTYTAAATFNTLNQAPTANAGGPYSVTEGSPLNLAGSGTDADGDPLTYSWDVNGDGVYGDTTGANAALSGAQREPLGANDGPRTFNVRVRVSDGKDATISAPTTLTVNNAVPDATASNGGPVNEGSTATVSVSNVTDASAADTAAGFRYGYDFDNNGTYEVGAGTWSAASTSSSVTVPASFLDDNGTRTVRIVVLDKDSGPRGLTTAITVNNVAPTATFASGVGPTVPENAPAAAVFSNQQDPSAADAAALHYAYDFNGDGNWDAGDGTYAGGVTQSSMTIPEQYRRDDATLTVRGAIIDKDGGRNEYQYTLTITNTAPTATATDRTVPEGQTATVGLTQPTDVPADSPTLRYIYDLDGDATDDTAGVTYANATAATTADVPADLTADGPGTVLTRIRIIDKDGGSTVYTETVTVTNVAPTARLNDSSVDEGSTATVGALDVADPGSKDAVRYVYDLDGNGTDDTAAVAYANASTATTADVPANLTADGPATVRVRVRVIDKDGASNVYTADVSVKNVAPSFTPAAPPVDEGAVATVSVTGVTDPSAADGAAGTRYAYDFDDDGTYDLGGTTYAAASPLAQADLPAALTADGPGTRTVKVAVVDKDDGLTEHTVDVEVRNVAPTATLADVTAVEGTTAMIAFTGADDVSAADKAAGFTFEWDADGDGTFDKGTGSIAVPAPDGPATKTIKGAILDKDGGRRQYTATLTITNAAPTATIAGPDAVPSSGATTLTLQLADAGDDTLTSSLDWGDGTTDTIDGAGEKTATHTYTAPGEKTITLVATDSDGAKGEATHTLTVAAAPAAPAPPATTTPTATTPKQTITGVKVTPRCLRADDLRARIAKARTMKVRFTLGTAAPVKFALERLSGKRGASKCPPPRGRKHPDGKRVPGVYRPFTDKSITVKKGANTVTVAATGKRGKRLAPGTYLLTVTSNGVSARTKLWVLAN
jgi:hypothetical protein